MAYNIETHRGIVTNVSTSVETGQTWYLSGTDAAFKQVLAARGSTSETETVFYARNGMITSCDDSVPDYHFKAKEIKMVSKNIMVARPVVLYIGEVPVMWLPFIFQDMRSGRRSGVLSPRFGVSELFRNSPTYRRHAENLGYYFAISDYMDAQLALDWRSGARSSDGDPGWVRLNGEMQYRWLDRFLTGRMALFRHSLRDGTSNTGVSWNHNQSFSQSTSLSANVNYVTNTRIQRNTTFNPQQVLATINSQANYQTKIGPAAISLGGSRTQYSGRNEVAQSFPNFGIQVPTLQLTPWLEWSPGFNFQTDQRLNIDQVGEFNYRYFERPDGTPDSVRLKRNTRNTSSSFSTPIKIGGFSWSNSFSLREQESNAPADDHPQRSERLVGKNHSRLCEDFLHRGRLADGHYASELSAGKLQDLAHRSASRTSTATHSGSGPSRAAEDSFIRASALWSGWAPSPTLFALFPGFGSVTRFRHSITPALSYNYAPSADVSSEFLRALNKTKQGYLGSPGAEQSDPRFIALARGKAANYRYQLHR